MKPDFTATGIRVQTYQEIYDELADGYRAIYGEDINLDPNSPDGQRVGIEAQARLDLQTFGLTLYNQLDPDFAIGQALNRLIKFSGITRRPPARSQVDVTVTTDRPLTLPVDYTVEDEIGRLWLTLSPVSLAAGANTVTLFAENFGAVEADPETVTAPVTVVIGVVSVNNAAAALVGRDEETDEALKIRRNRSLETITSSSLGRIFNALGDLPGVTDLAVYENDTDETDTLGIPAHSLWIIVEGGAVDEIAETLAKNKTGGKGMVGDVDGQWNETVIKPNGTEFIIIHAMKFDRPTYVPVLVRLTATRKDSEEPVDIELIQNKVAERVFTIGQNLLASDVYRDVFKAGDGFIPTLLEVSRDDGATWTDGRIETAPNEKFTLDAEDVDVTEVV